MELTKDFKKTEVGTIPNDWSVAAIGDVCDIKVGRDLYEDRYSQVSDYNFKYPVFSNTVSDYGLYGYYNFPEYEGEAVTVVGRGVGLGCAFPRSGGFGAIGRLLVLFPNKTVKNHFLSSYINNRITIFNESGGIPQLTGISFSRYKVPVPPVKEQEAIGNVLSDVDAYIESLEKLIAKKRMIKKGVMQELLSGKRRLEGFNSKEGFKETEIGKIPTDWQIKLLPEICKFKSGKAHEQFIVDDGPYVCVNSKFISSEGAIRKYASQNFCSAQKNDILMVMSDLPNGKALAKIFMVDQDDLYAVNQRVCVLTSYRDDPFFLGLQLNRNPYFLKFDDGVSQTHLLNRVFEKCPVILPTSIDEQKAISHMIMDMSADLTQNENNLQKARLIKQGMMQELLTGRIRLV